MRYDLRDSFLKAACDLPGEISSKIWKSIRQLSRTPDASGLNLEKLSGKADWLVYSHRSKIRAILHVDDERIMTLLFVGLHQDAYHFAETVPRKGFVPVSSGGARPKRSRYEEMDRPRTLPEPLAAPHMPAPSADIMGRPRMRSLMELAFRSRTAKYVPLARYLLNLGPAERSITLSFSEVERILGPNETLPKSARRYRPWWANDTTGHVQASAWLSAGWRVAKVSLPNESVTFEDFEADSDAD